MYICTFFDVIFFFPGTQILFVFIPYGTVNVEFLLELLDSERWSSGGG